MPDSNFIERRANIKNINISNVISSYEPQILREIIDSDSIKKFVSAGRIGALQKNHYDLIKIFEEYKMKTKDNSILIILGGYGNASDKKYFQVKKTKWKLKHSKFKDDIFIARTNNIYNLVKKCDLFIFPSIYEGQGLVIPESVSVGTPALVSDCPVLKEQAMKYNHSKYLSLNNHDSWVENMMNIDNLVKEFDVDKYNEDVIKSIKRIILDIE